MTWWMSVLCTLGVIGFWPALLFVGDKISHAVQRRAELQMRQPGQEPRTIGGE